MNAEHAPQNADAGEAVDNRGLSLPNECKASIGDEPDSALELKEATSDETSLKDDHCSRERGTASSLEIISASHFYGVSGKRKYVAPALAPGKGRRKALRSIACDERNQWRVFAVQSEAFAHCDERAGLGLRTWAFEIDGKGRRRFITASYQAFWRVYSRILRKNMRTHFYEVIREQHAAKLYLDLEFVRDCNADADGDAMMRAVVAGCLREAREVASSDDGEHREGAEREDGQVMVLDSTTEKKFSRHVIFQRLAFHNNVQMGDFVRRVVDRIARGAERGLVMVHAKDGQEVSFVDVGVYTRNRCFRLVGSSKFGKTARLLLAGTRTDRVCVSQRDFDRSLVCSVSDDALLLGTGNLFLRHGTTLQHGGGGALQHVRIYDGLNPPNDGGNVTSSHSVGRTEGSYFERRYAWESPFPKVDEYVLSIVQPCGGDIHGVTILSQSNTVMYAIKGSYKFCANIGRHHKSNNVILVADLTQRCMFQRCFDPDCRGFRSQAWEIPGWACQKEGLDELNDEALVAMMEQLEDGLSQYDGGVTDDVILQAIEMLTS